MNDRSAQGALISAVAILTGLGLVMVQSTTAAAAGTLVAPHFLKHTLALALGVGLAVGIAHLPVPLWRRIAVPLWLASLTLLALTLWLGVEVNGARRWLQIPGLRFQPGEIAKLATLLAVATWLSRRGPPRVHTPYELAMPALIGLAPALLLVGQPDFGNAVLLATLVAVLLFVAGAPVRLLLAPAVAGAAAIAAYVTLRPYAWYRVTGFLDPWKTSDSAGFQLVQSFVAFGSGGLFGVGLGDGRQKLFYLPEAHTDFILSVVAEELGLVGVLVVLGAFAALLFAGLQIARRARAGFDLLLAFGATALLTVPALLNGAVVMGLLPTKGMPLPFLSYGRTALLVSFVAVGLLLAVARGEGGEITRRERLGLGRRGAGRRP